MPAVSVIMPAFNRADTIDRSVASVCAQHFTDWELIVVDDGSTDGTAARIPCGDSRIRVIRQENQGMARARNAGVRASTGAFLAFLDSDDEWFPYHLNLAMSFFARFPEEHVFTAELLEDCGHGKRIAHYRIEISEWYKYLARRVGSRLLDARSASSDTSDEYLRIFESCEPVTPWARDALAHTPFLNANLYRGRIFEQMRWGFLFAVQPSVITRHAWTIAGEFEAEFGGAADFGFGARLAQAFTFNYIGLPTALKHTYAPSGANVVEEHVAAGKNHIALIEHLMRYFEKFFLTRNPNDPELRRLFAIRLTYLAALYLGSGRRRDALRVLERACVANPSSITARLLHFFTRSLSSTRFPYAVAQMNARLTAFVVALGSGDRGVRETIGQAVEFLTSLV